MRVPISKINLILYILLFFYYYMHVLEELCMFVTQILINTETTITVFGVQRLQTRHENA